MWICGYVDLFCVCLCCGFHFHSQIEEKILETLTWETGSPVYTAIKSHGVPKCQDVTTESPVMAPVYFMSPTNVRFTKDVV